MAEVVSRFAETFLERCATSFKDPCARVGRDPLRKLQRNERILSSIDLARKHGIETPALTFGAALAIHHALRCEDSKDQEAQAIRQVYRENDASVEAVLTRDGDCNGKRFPGLHPIRDEQLITTISEAFRQYPQRDMATRRDDLCIGA